MITDDEFNSFEFYLKDIVTEKEKLKIIKEKKDELISLIKDINWSDLVIIENNQNGNSKLFEVDFNEQIIQKIEYIKNEYKHLRLLVDVGQDILFEGNELNMRCPIQIDILSNRIHITGDGIPRSIRGLGLSCKIYRAILEHVDYVSSEGDRLYGYGKLIWNSLRKSDLFYTFFEKSRGYCFASDKDSSDIIRILEKEINIDSVDELLCDESFIKKNKAIIKKTSLNKLMLKN